MGHLNYPTHALDLNASNLYEVCANLKITLNVCVVVYAAGVVCIQFPNAIYNLVSNFSPGHSLHSLQRFCMHEPTVD